ncbi:CBS domain-containing protein [Lutibacter sp. TH_r2]|uniref:CBS domain-containing protein n=1 Tax=Lutibacter sp. TH_r2 TaxID=3082083 RepID=UPI002954BFA6|nr:CBS domain-containing protein [Lutibacter sp. TH_r2]MDV7187032.1 CBS domain-containing protein [Lutibacter sp. TH_r2]
MKRLEPVSKIMTKQLITLSLNDNLYKAEQLFKENNIRHIPVLEGKKLIGMLSHSDLERISFLDSFDSKEIEIDNAVYEMFDIQQIMIKNLVTINSNISVKSTAEILAKNQFHSLPIVDDNELVGMVTTTDLLNYLLKQYELEAKKEELI